MPDLYAINLHLQERLERNRIHEVRAAGAARWLDDAGLLKDRRNGLPLRRLLRAGRIAGHEQRPDRKGGTWFIRRLAACDDQNSIHKARQQLRRYLLIERDYLPADWPLPNDNPAFWKELGKTVAVFGYLEHTLVKACYGLTPPPADIARIRTDQVPAYLEWYRKMEAPRTDTLGHLTDRFIKFLKKHRQVPRAVREDLHRRLNELRPWRNALA